MEREASHAERPIEEDARELAGRVVQGFYRLVKACQLHAESNQAVAQVVESVRTGVEDLCRVTGQAQASILFTKNAVFVNRKMLRASRETYQLALDLGQMLAGTEVTEVTAHTGITAQELSDFGRLMADFLRDQQKARKLVEGGFERLRTRKVLGLSHDGNVPPPTRAARTYAAALMILRAFYGDLRAGKYELRQGLKRIAQKVVSQNDVGARLLLSIAAAPPTDADRAGSTLAAAIIAHAMAAQITEDRAVLTTLVGAALTYDAGRQRLVGYPDAEGGNRIERSLNETEEELVPSSAVVALTALGKLHAPSLVRTVVVHEALALRDAATLPYAGRRSPSLLARVLATARAFVDLRTRRGPGAGLGMDDALQVLESQATDNTGRALVKLLTGALGIFPAGTMVEFNTGEMGVVVATPTLPVDFARPPVRVMYDERGQLLDEPIDTDLARLGPGETYRVIRRTIDASDQQMKQMRAYVAQLSAKRARRSFDKLRAVQRAEDVKAPAQAPAIDSVLAAASVEAKPPAAPARQDARNDDFDGFELPPLAGARPLAPIVPSANKAAAEPPKPIEPVAKPVEPRIARVTETLSSASAARPTETPVSASAVARATSTPVSAPGAARPTSTPVSAPGAARSTSTPVSSPGTGDTDALLAAYLSDDDPLPRPESKAQEAAEPASWGVRWTGAGTQDSPSSPGRSAGLRWGGSSPGTSPGRSLTNSGPSSGGGQWPVRQTGTPLSSPGWPARETGNAGLWPARETGAAPGRAPASGLSNPARGVTGGPDGPRSAGGLRWSKGDERGVTGTPPPVSTTAPASVPASPVSEVPPPSSNDPRAEVESSPESTGPVPSVRSDTRGRKAGSSAWGATPKRDQRK